MTASILIGLVFFLLFLYGLNALGYIHKYTKQQVKLLKEIKGILDEKTST